MKLIKLTYIISSILLASTIHAKELYNNGEPVNSGNGVNNSYEAVMDDVYVPGAGWFVEEVETQGIFFESNQSVSQVDVIIWQSTVNSFEPDGDIVQQSFYDVPFTATLTGDDWGGYEKIEVVADIPRTFLKGQNYYWVEFDITDESGDNFKLIETSGIENLPAYLNSGGNGSELYSAEIDLAYKIFGDEVTTIMPVGSSEFKIDDLDKRKATQTFQIANGSKKFEPGLYQIQMLRKTPVVYRFDESGKKRIDFKADPLAPMKFHTPIGDYMCELAPPELQHYCQTFVACAAHDLFC